MDPHRWLQLIELLSWHKWNTSVCPSYTWEKHPDECMNMSTVRKTSGGFIVPQLWLSVGLLMKPVRWQCKEKFPEKPPIWVKQVSRYMFQKRVLFVCFLPYYSLVFINAKLFGCLTFNIVFCCILSFDSSDTTLMLPLTKSSLSAICWCRSRVVPPCTNQMGTGHTAIAHCSGPRGVSCCHNQLNALCSVGCSERTRGMYNILQKK